LLEGDGFDAGCATTVPEPIMATVSTVTSMMIGLVGFALLMYGKRQSRLLHLAAGIALIAYPWFVSNLALQLLIGAAIAGLLVVATRAGL
jgi:hypothetical protein